MTALDKCPLLGFFATASEDGYIKVRIFYLLQMTLKWHYNHFIAHILHLSNKWYLKLILSSIFVKYSCYMFKHIWLNKVTGFCLQQVWNRHNQLVREMYFGEPLFGLCFANARGDLLLGFQNHIWFVFSLVYQYLYIDLER